MSVKQAMQLQAEAGEERNDVVYDVVGSTFTEALLLI